tara:strand:- start:236 stop:427 length:192 start_codon:yes stop_codon:yes gene_type:complete
MVNQVVIHCNQNVKNYIDYIDVEYTKTHDEFNVIVNNIDILDDEALCSHYGIIYDDVNCIELI